MPLSDRRRRAVRFIIRSRTVRKKFFPAKLFGEPAWDMLLTLYATALDEEAITAEQLCEASGAGPLTVGRWIEALERGGLLIRGEVPPNGSGTFTLSEKGWFAMDSYFENMSSGMI